MADSGRTVPFSSRARDFTTLGSRPRAAVSSDDMLLSPMARDGLAQSRDDVSATLAKAHLGTPAGLPASKALLLIDDMRLTRECLTYLLATELKDFETISVVHPQQAAECRVSPHVVLLHARATKRSDGALLNDIALIASATHQAPVLLLSDGEDAAEAAEAGEYGVAGAFPTSCGVPLLIAAINLVVAGGSFRVPRAVSSRSVLASNALARHGDNSHKRFSAPG